jgi:hypothetical protein
MSTSKAPISAPDAGTLAQLARSGWTVADWQWERCCVQAARAYTHTWLDGGLDGGLNDETAAAWREALKIARESFAGDDPRLPASLVANAVLLAGTGAPAGAARLLGEAERAWGRVGLWVARMRLDAPARSSIYHLRLELRHADTYARQRRDALLACVRQARAHAARRLQVPNAPFAAPELEAWTDAAPAGFNDRRKLVAALTLMPDPVAAATAA